VLEPDDPAQLMYVSCILLQEKVSFIQIHPNLNAHLTLPWSSVASFEVDDEVYWGIAFISQF